MLASNKTAGVSQSKLRHLSEELNIISLPANGVAPYIYNWGGPNGFTSNLYNPFVNEVGVQQSGNYQLNIIVDDCPSPTADKTYPCQF